MTHLGSFGIFGSLVQQEVKSVEVDGESQSGELTIPENSRNTTRGQSWRTEDGFLFLFFLALTLKSVICKLASELRPEKKNA